MSTRRMHAPVESLGHGSSTLTEPTATTGSFAGKKALYRDAQGGARQTQNIMYDRRVVRGSTIAAPVLSPAAIAEIERRERDSEDRAQKQLVESRRRAVEARRERTPEPVPGRVHADLQTETYLEVLSDRLPEEEIGVQTDALMDRPSTPLFVPKPTGVDADTQIDPRDSDLFDFDYEVEPLLQVLVGKALESAVMELAQEAEMAAIKARQQEFMQVRNAELAEVQRLESEVKRRQAEKARRLQQEKDRVAREVELQQKAAGTAFARSYLVAMRARLVETLRKKGFFYNPLRREIETMLLPEILGSLGDLVVSREQTASGLADELLHVALSDAAAKCAELRQRIKEEKEASEAAALAAVEEAKRLKEERKLKRQADKEAAEAAARAAEEAENAEEAE